MSESAGFKCSHCSWDICRGGSRESASLSSIGCSGLNGGWPLNVFNLPDQRPFYGGTYFQPKQWLHILNSIIQAFHEKRQQLEESAKEFSKAISITDSEKYGLVDHGFSANLKELKQMAFSMKNHFDKKEGGLSRAPKFPNPSIWNFLLTSNVLIQDKEIHDQVMLTLDKMSSGGIYDQIGGGFARYSVDENWFAPHFEKMLYDNGQLISLYSIAYKIEKNEIYREVVFESIAFVRRELMMYSPSLDTRTSLRTSTPTICTAPRPPTPMTSAMPLRRGAVAST